MFRKLKRLSDYKYYTSLDKLPIYNWYKLHKEHDLKYLLLLEDYSQKIRISTRFKDVLKAQYEAFLSMIEDLDLSVLRAKQSYINKLIELVIKIAQQSTDYTKLDNAYKIILGLMITDEPETDWLWKVDFTQTTDQRALLTEIALAIKRYHRTKSVLSHEQTLNEKIVVIERVLGVKIDQFKCSVNLFKEYEKQTVEKIRIENKILSDGNG